MLADEDAEQVELLGGQLQLLALEPGTPSVRVDPDEVSGVGGRVERRAPQEGTDPGEQLGQPEADHGVDLVGSRREDEYRDASPLCPEATADLEPVDLGQSQVEQDQVRVVLRAVQRGGPVLADVDVVPLAAQRTGEWLGDRWVVLSQQHSRHVTVLESPCGPTAWVADGHRTTRSLPISPFRATGTSLDPPTRSSEQLSGVCRWAGSHRSCSLDHGVPPYSID